MTMYFFSPEKGFTETIDCGFWRPKQRFIFREKPTEWSNCLSRLLLMVGSFPFRWGTVPPANSLSFSPHLNTFHFTKDLLWPRRFQEKKTSQSSLNRVYVILFVLSIKMKALAFDCTIEMKNSADFPSRFISHHRKASSLTFQRWVCRPWVKFWNRRTHTFPNTHTTRVQPHVHTRTKVFALRAKAQRSLFLIDRFRSPGTRRCVEHRVADLGRFFASPPPPGSRFSRRRDDGQ